MNVNENIIRNALNESIDEFLLEEGAFDGLKNWWNSSANGQRVKNGLSSVWNNVKNAAAMYMDKQTNGQWNQKYGIYVNANNKMGELFYLNKWFNYYKQQLNYIIQQADNPSQRDEYDLYERDPNTGKETIKRRKYDYVGVNGALLYAQQYCTFQNFNAYMRNLSPKRESVTVINTYIQNYITKPANQKNIKTVLNNLNISVFYGSKEGQEYLMMNRGQQQKNSRRNRIQNAWDNRKQQQQQQNFQPVPNNGDGTFNVGTIECPQKRGWYYSTDANKRNILVNSANPKQAIFV